MDEQKIKNLVNELDLLVPRENAKIIFEEYGGGTDEDQFRGTKNGYLRFGIEIMKGAFAPIESNTPGRIQVDVKEFISNASNVGIDSFYRDESVSDKDFTETWKDKLIGYSFLGAVILLFACIPVGLYTIGKFILDLSR